MGNIHDKSKLAPIAPPPPPPKPKPVELEKPVQKAPEAPKPTISIADQQKLSDTSKEQKPGWEQSVETTQDAKSQKNDFLAATAPTGDEPRNPEAKKALEEARAATYENKFPPEVKTAEQKKAFIEKKLAEAEKKEGVQGENSCGAIDQVRQDAAKMQDSFERQQSGEEWLASSNYSPEEKARIGQEMAKAVAQTGQVVKGGGSDQAVIDAQNHEVDVQDQAFLKNPGLAPGKDFKSMSPAEIQQYLKDNPVGNLQKQEKIDFLKRLQEMPGTDRTEEMTRAEGNVAQDLMKDPTLKTQDIEGLSPSTLAFATRDFSQSDLNRIDGGVRAKLLEGLNHNQKQDIDRLVGSLGQTDDMGLVHFEANQDRDKTYAVVSAMSQDQINQLDPSDAKAAFDSLRNPGSYSAKEEQQLARLYQRLSPADQAEVRGYSWTDGSQWLNMIGGYETQK